MTDSTNGLDAETLKRNRKHFGKVPFYFEVRFEGENEPSMLNVDEVWKAHTQGKKPVSFKGTDLLSKQQQAFLAALATIMETQP